jgi:ketosteroid isomerase-like protein
MARHAAHFDSVSDSGLISGTPMLRHSISTCWVLVLALLVAAFAAPACYAFVTHHERPKRAARETIESMEDQWRLAELNGDAGAMDRLLSDDFVGITAFGQVTTKAQQLAHMSDHSVTLRQLNLSDTKVKLIGSIVGVVTSRAEIQGTRDGMPFSGTFLYTRVYQRVASGPWKITSLEATSARPDRGQKPHPDSGHPEPDTLPSGRP